MEFNKVSAQVSGFKTKQLHVEGEGGVRRDDARVPFAAVGEVWRADQLRPLTYTHLQRRKRRKETVLTLTGATESSGAHRS